jgi:23S rRNA (guanosine2251-2'-O)-methyltransferase
VARDAVVIEGVRPVIEAVRAGRRRVLEVRVRPGRGSPGIRELEALAAERKIPLSHVADGPERVSALADPFPEERFEDLLAASGPRFLVALDGVTDVGNLGSIARSAEVAGASGLVLEHRHAPPISPAALRASAGALEHLRVGRTPNLGRALALARAEGLAVLLADPAGIPIADLDPGRLRGDLLWLFGSEDRGVRPGLRTHADVVVSAPVRGRVGSLGVAAAAAYLLLRTSELRG